MAEETSFQALNLDINQQQSFVRFFKSLPEKAASTVRFFSRIDYYTLHDEDAKLAADYTSKVINYMGAHPKLSYVCINKFQMESLVRELLLVRHYRVEVYVRTSAKGNDWQLEYKGSPGNLTQFEQILFENVTLDSSNSVMAIKIIKNNMLAVSNVNTTDLTFEVCEFTDNECFTDLEALLAQIGPKECLLPSGESPELKNLKILLERNGVLVARVKRTDFSSADIIQDLTRLLFFQIGQKRNAELFPETELKEALGCLQAIIKFLNLTGTESNFNQYRLSKLDAHKYVRIDNAALYALNVLPKPLQDSEGAPVFSNTPKYCSLIGILNNCVTSQGKRLLEQWIKQPLKDVVLINERLDIVECLVKDSEHRMLCKDALTKIPDLMLISKRLSGKKAKLQDCYKLYQGISQLPSLINILRSLDNKTVKDMFVSPMSEYFNDMDKFQAMIDTFLDMDLVARNEFLIKSNVDPELDELNSAKQKIEEKMQTLLRRAARELNLEEGKSIKLECNNQLGYYFRITKKDESAFRQAKGFKVIDSVAGGIRFSNEKLTMLNEDYSAKNEKYEERQQGMVEQILEVAVGYADTVRSINMCVAALDVLLSFAKSAVSAKLPYVRPIMKPLDQRVLKLKQARHPCLEQQEQFHFIPNDVNLDEEDKAFYIITGPNMCGKSTYIRSIGMCVLMAHIGSFVPCEGAEISLVDGILARVGAYDCLLKGISSFMLEMIETSTIIKTATKNSLVIIDELGRGTSTYDGCGLAWAIAEHLALNVKCFSLFATHFHKISKMADTLSSVGNLHVSAITSADTITPLYQVHHGECDQSYGIHCAKIAEFPPDILTWAEDNLKQLEHHQGLKYIKDFEIPIKKKIIGEGDELVNTICEKLAKAANETDLEKIVASLRSDVEKCDNLFVKGLVET